MKKEKVGEEKEQGANPLFAELLCHLCLCFCCRPFSSANQPVSRLVETGLRIKKKSGCVKKVITAVERDQHMTLVDQLELADPDENYVHFSQDRDAHHSMKRPARRYFVVKKHQRKRNGLQTYYRF